MEKIDALYRKKTGRKRERFRLFAFLTVIRVIFVMGCDIFEGIHGLSQLSRKNDSHFPGQFNCNTETFPAFCVFEY
jgi:hypothetical protein